MIRRCPAHGLFDGPCCPTCEHGGRPVLDDERRLQLSKFISGALRHFPGDVGLSPDEHGWVEAGDLFEATTSRYPWADGEAIAAVVRLDPRGRFEIDEATGRVRAAYGHSIDVDLEGQAASGGPRVLYHGTAPGNLDAIRKEGLQPMGRQEVHLSPDVETAYEVGARHAGEPVILRVDAEVLEARGIEVHRRAEAVYTCARVPPELITVEETGSG